MDQPSQRFHEIVSAWIGFMQQFLLHTIRNNFNCLELLSVAIRLRDIVRTSPLFELAQPSVHIFCCSTGHLLRTPGCAFSCARRTPVSVFAFRCDSLASLDTSSSLSTTTNSGSVTNAADASSRSAAHMALALSMPDFEFSWCVPACAGSSFSSSSPTRRCPPTRVSSASARLACETSSSQSLARSSECASSSSSSVGRTRYTLKKLLT